MKQKLVLAGMMLFMVAGFSACKKQNKATEPLRTKMLGKWQVNKVDVTTYSTAGTPSTVSTSYTTSDYMDFKDTESDDVELSLGTNNRMLGFYKVRINDTFFLDFSQKDLECTTTVIGDKEFRFTGTVVGSNPKVTETYYLSR